MMVVFVLVVNKMRDVEGGKQSGVDDTTKITRYLGRTEEIRSAPSILDGVMVLPTSCAVLRANRHDWTKDLVPYPWLGLVGS
jgi:hypothetical protein